MARDTITVTNTVRAGVLATVTTPNAGNDAEMANPNGRVGFVFVNGLGAASVQATAITVQQVDDPYGRKENDAAFTVTVDNVGVFGPFPPALYNQSDGTVQFDYDAVSANARVFGLSVL
jgi:hypothetical protein